MKRIIAILLSIITIFALVACSCDDNKDEEKDKNNKQAEETMVLKGNVYKANIETVNIAYEDDKKPTDAQLETLTQQIKIGFKDSIITFTDENSFTLTETNNNNHNFTANDCLREGNELFKTIEKRGDVDVLVEGEKLSMYMNFYTDRQVYIEYNLVK